MNETWVCTKCQAVGVIGVPHRVSLHSQKPVCYADNAEWVSLDALVANTSRNILRSEFTGVDISCCEFDTDGDGNCPRHPVTA